MAPRRSDTRERIMNRARSLLQRHGLDGFSYRDIAGHVGIRNAAIHYHFPSKEDLGLALIEAFESEVRAEIAQARAAGVPPEVQLEVYFERARHEVEDGCRICLFGALATSFGRLDPSLQEAARRLWRGLHQWLAETLDAGRSQGVFHFSGKAEDKALALSSAIQGARQISRMVQSDAVERVIAQIRGDLGLEA